MEADMWRVLLLVFVLLTCGIYQPLRAIFGHNGLMQWTGAFFGTITLIAFLGVFIVSFETANKKAMWGLWGLSIAYWLDGIYYALLGQGYGDWSIVIKWGAWGMELWGVLSLMSPPDSPPPDDTPPQKPNK